MVTRQQWLRAVRGPDYPPRLRVLRGTLLCLPVSQDGRITATDDDISIATGLPRRTVQWHLRKAEQTGWLTRQIKRGGNGRRCRFTLSIPGQDETTSAPASCALPVRNAVSTPDPAPVRNLVANLNKTRASVSEHLAVNGRRHGNHDAHIVRVSPSRLDKQERSEGRVAPVTALAAISPKHRHTYAYQLRRTA